MINSVIAPRIPYSFTFAITIDVSGVRARRKTGRDLVEIEIVISPAVVSVEGLVCSR